MTYYDAAMAAIVVAGMVWGAWRGITWQLASVASLVLGYTVAHTLSPQLAPRFPGDPAVARALAMLVIYTGVSLGVFLVAWIVRSTLRKLKFEAFDRHLGMLLGGIEGALLGMIATLFVVSVAPQTRTPIFTSPAGRIVGQVMNFVGPVLPGEARQVLAPFWGVSGGATLADETNASGPAPLAQQDTPVRTGNGVSGGAPTAANFEKMLEDGETRLGRVIVETAEKGLQPQTGDGNDRTVERR
jgi:uncharacterized membrane protein required for colicin V production